MLTAIRRKIRKKFRKPIGIYRNRGDKYLCPFCGYKAANLAPLGKRDPIFVEKQLLGARRNGGCYKCYSTDRERLVYVFLKDKLRVFENPKNLKVLHFSPESNLFEVLNKSSLKEYVCGDLFEEGYESAYNSVVQNMNVLEIPFEDNHFDLIICNHVLEHVPEDRAAMQELYRVLKKGGKAILQVPTSRLLEETYEDFSITDSEERIKAFGQFDHVRIYGKDYSDRLRSVGFEVEVHRIWKEYPKVGLNPNEEVFLALK